MCGEESTGVLKRGKQACPVQKVLVAAGGLRGGRFIMRESIVLDCKEMQGRGDGPPDERRSLSPIDDLIQSQDPCGGRENLQMVL